MVRDLDERRHKLEQVAADPRIAALLPPDAYAHVRVTALSSPTAKRCSLFFRTTVAAVITLDHVLDLGHRKNATVYLNLDWSQRAEDDFICLVRELTRPANFPLVMRAIISWEESVLDA